MPDTTYRENYIVISPVVYNYDYTRNLINVLLPLACPQSKER